MKNKSEDKFGVIINKDHQFNSLEEAGNYTKDLKEKLKRKASMEEFPISVAMPEDRLKFIEYGLSLMTKKNLPFYNINKIKCARAVMWLIAKGYTFTAIAGYLKKNGFTDVNIQKVKDVEKEGMEMAMKAIERVRNTKIPIFSPQHQQIKKDFQEVLKDRRTLV